MNMVTVVNPVSFKNSPDSLGNKFSKGFANTTALGDSITAGGGAGVATSGNGYADLVGTYLNARFNSVKFYNKGVGGNSVIDGYNRIATDIIPNSNDLILVELGTNDWGSQDLAGFESNYRILINALLAQTTAKLICISLGYFASWIPERTIREDKFNLVIAKVAKELGLVYVDVREAILNEIGKGIETFATLSYAPDAVHPSLLGHKVWADAVIKAIDSFINLENGVNVSNLPPVSLVELPYKPIEEVFIWNALEIRSSEFQFSPLFDLSKYKKVKVIGHSTLNQSVTVRPNLSDYRGEMYWDGTTWQQGGQIPPCSFGSADFDYILSSCWSWWDKSIINKLQLSAGCAVAPTTGSLTIKIVGIPN